MLKSSEAINENLYRLTVYAEYGFLAITFFLNLTAMQVAFRGDGQMLLTMSTLFLLGLLAPLKTYNWPFPLRALSCILDCALVSVALWCGVTRFVQPLFLCVIAKAAVLLPVPYLCAIVFVACGSELALELVKVWRASPAIAPSVALMSCGLLVIGSTLSKVVTAVLVVVVNREQQSRSKAERLSLEVEKLARELERARLSREIHDALGHSLTSLKIQLDVADKYASVSEADARQAIAHAKELATRALQDVRNLLRCVRDGDLDLDAAVKNLVNEANSGKLISVEAELQDGKVQAPAAFATFRIVQECLTNAMKHSAGDRVSIKIVRDSGNLVVTVADNGRGFSGDHQPGIGLSGIRERVSELGGAVELNNQSTGGALVRAVIPLEGKLT